MQINISQNKRNFAKNTQKNHSVLVRTTLRDNGFVSKIERLKPKVSACAERARVRDGRADSTKVRGRVPRSFCNLRSRILLVKRLGCAEMAQTISC